MRHNVAGRLFGRTANQRKALLRGLMSAVLEHQRIETTVAKAKETRKLVERMVTLAKRGDLHSKRLALAKLPNRTLIVKLFDEIAPRFADRNGGYMRIIRTRRRVNDRAEMAVLEFVDYEEAVLGQTMGKEKSGKKSEAKAKAAKKAKPEQKPGAKEKKPEAKEKKAPESEPAEAVEVKEKKTTAKKKATAKKTTAAKKTTVKKKAAATSEKKTTAKKKAAPAKKKSDK